MTFDYLLLYAWKKTVSSINQCNIQEHHEASLKVAGLFYMFQNT